MRPYQILEHKADLKIKGWGSTLQELFANLAKGMLAASMIIDKKISEKWRDFEIDSVSDYESLLVNFLNEIWFLASKNREIYTDFIFEKFGLMGIKGKVKSFPAKKIKLEIKAATFYDLKIEKKDSEYSATVVFDI